MRAWQVRELGEPRDVLALADIPDPDPGPGQVLVRVRGATAHFFDALMCRGNYQVRPPRPARAASRRPPAGPAGAARTIRSGT